MQAGATPLPGSTCVVMVAQREGPMLQRRHIEEGLAAGVHGARCCAGPPLVRSNAVTLEAFQVGELLSTCPQAQLVGLFCRDVMPGAAC
jgi:hypothetical protein